MYDIISLICPILSAIGYIFLVIAILVAFMLLYVKRKMIEDETYDEKLTNKIKRYIRYIRICIALRIIPHYWQRDFILNNKPISGHIEKGEGKTTAVLIKLILDANDYTAESDIIRTLLNDKDFVLSYKDGMRFYQTEYNHLRKECLDNGIDVSYINFFDLTDTFKGGD